MVEVRLSIPDDIVKAIQAKIGENVKVTDIARDAVTLFNWAVNERSRGRLVLSSENDGMDMARLTMHSLDTAAAKSENAKTNKDGGS